MLALAISSKKIEQKLDLREAYYLKMYKVLREFAKDNGWTFRLGSMFWPYISGEYRGHPFNFDFGSYHFRLLRMPRFRMLLTLPISNSENVEFRLYGGFYRNFVNFIRPSGLQIGEKSFDQQFVLTGKPERLVLKLFSDSKIWRQLRDIKIRIGGISFKLGGQMLMCEPQFADFSTKNVISVLDIACDLADATDALKE